MNIHLPKSHPKMNKGINIISWKIIIILNNLESIPSGKAVPTIKLAHE
jgi:hypothetical protein